MKLDIGKLKEILKGKQQSDTTNPSILSSKTLPNINIKKESSYTGNSKNNRVKAYQDSLSLYNKSIDFAKNLSNSLSKGAYDNDIKYGVDKKTAQKQYKKNINWYNKNLVDPITKGRKPDFGQIVKYNKNIENTINVDQINDYKQTVNSKDEQSRYVANEFLKRYSEFEKINKKIKPVSYSLAAELPPIPIYKKPTEYKEPEPSILYTEDLNDPRLKSYQDSLSLYNNNTDASAIKKLIKQGVYKRVISNVEGQVIQPIEQYNPNIAEMNRLDKLGEPYSMLQPTITKETNKLYYKDKDGYIKDRKKGNIVLSSARVYKKPVQPVEYRKSQPKKEQQPKKEEPKLVERKKNTYEGSPVYSPGAGSGIASALIGFRNKNGDTTFISKDDYEKFAVPKKAQAYIESQNKK